MQRELNTLPPSIVAEDNRMRREPMWRMQSDSYPWSDSEESCYVAGLNNMIVSVFSTMTTDVLKTFTTVCIGFYNYIPNDREIKMGKASEVKEADNLFAPQCGLWVQHKLTTLLRDCNCHEFQLT